MYFMLIVYCHHHYFSIGKVFAVYSASAFPHCFPQETFQWTKVAAEKSAPQIFQIMRYLFVNFLKYPPVFCAFDTWHPACKNPAVFKGILGVKTLGSPTNPGQTEKWPWTWLCVWAFCRIIASVKCVFLHSFQVQLLAEVFCTIVSFILIN